MRDLLCLLLIAGGAAIFMGYQIPLTSTVDYGLFPGGSITAGSLMILLGLLLAVFGRD